MAEEYSTDAKEKNGDWQHLVEYCMDLYDEIKGSAYRKAKLEEIKESRAAYEQEEKSVSDPWEGASNTVLPLTTISADNIEPRLVAGLIGKRPFMRFKMENEQLEDEPTEILETWYNEELEDVIDIEPLTGDMMHLLGIEGTVFPMAEYDLDEVDRRDFLFAEDLEGERGLQAREYALEAGAVSQIGGVMVDAEGNPITWDSLNTVFEGGKVEVLKFNDVFIPDDSEDWEKTPLIRRVNHTYSELLDYEQKKSGYMNIGKWLLKEETQKKIANEDQSSAQDIAGVKVTGKETIKCLECHVKYIYQDEEEEKEDIEDFTEKRLVALIAMDKKIIIRLVELKDINFKNEHTIKRIRLFPEKGRAYGTSIYGKMRSIQKGATKTFNTAINIAEVTMIPWFLHTASVGFQNRKQKLKPGMGVEVDSVDGLYFPRFNINPAAMIDYINLWIQFWERLLSIGDLQLGRPNDDRGKRQTATEVMAVIQEGNIKHNYQVKTLRKEFLSLLVTIYDLYYQYMPLGKTFLWNGDYVPIPRNLMRRGYKFSLTGSTELSNKLIERKENEDLYTLTTQDPAQVFDPIVIREDLLKSYGKTDTNRYINPEIADVVEKIKEVPGAIELFNQAFEQAVALAQNIEQDGKAMAELADM